jgi:hypothetical protein
LALNTIFGSDAIRAAAAIANAGASGYNEMGQAMKDAGGAAQAAAIMQQGYKFTLDQFNAAVETLQITVGSALLPYLTQLVAAAAEGVNTFTGWASSILSASDPLEALAKQIGLVGVTTKGVRQMITDAAKVIFAAWNALSAALAPSTQTAWSAIQSAVQTALAAVRQAVQFATALVVQIWNAHGADILAFAQKTWEGIMSVVTAAAKFIQAAIEALVKAAQWIWGELRKRNHNRRAVRVEPDQSVYRNRAVGAARVVRGWERAVLRGDWGAAWEAIKGVAEALWNGIKASAENLMNALSSLFQTLYPRLEAAFQQALSGAASLGAALIDGIRDGVINAARGLADAVARAARDALDSARAALGIRSPSRVAAKEVGVPLAEGILRGLTEGLAPLPLLTRDAVTQPTAASTVNVGGITVNAAPGMDERRVALMVRSEIDNLTRLARFGRI